ncbi:MAG: hypothetical protein B6U85_09805 [Desulfurococcales archaeon ex4484_42]|nr:MAG: hypothetical protein B6U85_09805 [Desulfurococcales archaeon ex4484_42]
MELGKDNPKETYKLDLIASWISHKLRRVSFSIRRQHTYEYEGIIRVLDVLAEAPLLPDSNIRIGFKVHSNDILTVDDVERYIAWLDELPIDKLVIVAVGGVDVAAYELAKKHKIDIVKPSEELKLPLTPEAIKRVLGSYEEYHIEPLISLDEALKLMKERVRHHSLFKRKKKITEVALAYVPLITVYGEIAEKRIETEELMLRNVMATFEGIEGYPVIKRNTTLALDESLGSFSEISDEALTVLRDLSEYGSLSMSELASKLGLVHERLKDIVEALSNKMLVDLFGDLVEIRYSLFDYFVNPKEIAEIHKAKIHRGIPSEGDGRIVLPIKAYINRFAELIESLNGKLMGLHVTYYPFFVGVMSTNKLKAIKLYILDGLSLSENPSFCIPLSNIDIVETIRAKSIKVTNETNQ